MPMILDWKLELKILFQQSNRITVITCDDEIINIYKNHEIVICVELNIQEESAELLLKPNRELQGQCLV